MADIDKDLVRWHRGTWVAVTGLILLLQLALILFGSQKTINSRSVYPKEPVVAVSGPTTGPEWGDVEDPFLFASASWNGFSSDAWLQKPGWKAPSVERPVARRFLSLTEATKASPNSPPVEPLTFTERRRPTATFPEPPERVGPERKSELRIEGIAGRTLVSQLVPPVQVHNDVLLDSVVEALIGADGLVISTRLVENSGSPKADADAMSLARSARFGPKPGGNQSPELAKLIFQWHTVESGGTNRVNGGSNSLPRPR